MEILKEQWLVAIGQFLLGYVLKRNPSFPNYLIPIMTFIAAIAGFTVAPATAHALALGGAVTPALSLFAAALVQNLMVTGLHSTWKNSVKPAAMSALRALLGGQSG